MKKSDLFAMAWQNLRNRKTRTRLTIAGVVVGTFAIIIMVSIGIGIDKMITSQYKADSTLNKISVYSMGDYTNENREIQQAMPFDDSAVSYFSKIDKVKAVVPTLEISQYAKISRGKYTYSSTIYGIPLKEMEALGYKTEQGDFRKAGEKNACLAGKDTVTSFYDVQGNPPKYKYDSDYNVTDCELDLMKDSITISAKNQNSDSSDSYNSSTSIDQNGQSNSTNQQENGGVQKLNIIGTLKQTSNDYESSSAMYIDLDKAKQIVAQSNRLSSVKNYKLQYSSISVYCNDAKDVAQVKKELQSKGYSCSADDEGFQQPKKVMRVV